jgi:DNA-binding MarR family transcriptional regulator
MNKFENKKIMLKLLSVKNLLNQAGRLEVFFEHGLTVANFELLKIIQEENVETISELQEFLPDSLPSLTQKTQKLVELGFLKKEKDKNDPRKNILKITSAGQKALERVERKIELVSSAVFLKYSTSEKEKFLEMLEVLENKLSSKVEKINK